MSDENKSLDSILLDTLPDIADTGEIKSVDSTDVVMDTDIGDIDGDIDDLFNNAVEESKTDDGSESEDPFDLFADAEDDQTGSDESPNLFDLAQYDELTEDDLDTDSTFSDEFIDDETRLFISALTRTLELRSNPSATIERRKTERITTKRNNSKYTEFISIMKGVLDIVRVSNKERRLSVLPDRLREAAQCLEPGELSAYNDSKDVVWNEFYTRATESIGNDVKKRNKFSDGISDLHTIFCNYCEFYRNEDAYMNDAYARKSRNDRISANEFKFYMEILDRLRSGDEKVSLCNRVIFNPKNIVQYKFQCGRCKGIVSGAVKILPKGSINEKDSIPEGDNHNFYQVLTKNSMSLFYPMVCEDCGAINVLSSSTRDMMESGIKNSPTSESRDKTDYRDNNKDVKGEQSAGNRRWIKMTKWMDLLDSKLPSETQMSDEARMNMSEDEFLDSIFYIEEEEVNLDIDEIISEIDDSDYKKAIKAFRDRDNTINCKSDIEKSGSDSIEPLLALIVSNGMTTMLKDIYHLIASYIITTKAFKDLESAQTDKNMLYSKYLTLHSASKYCLNGLEVSKETIRDFESDIRVKYDLGEISVAEVSALNEYKQYRAKYDNLKDVILNSPIVYSYKRRDKSANALVRVFKAFEFDERLAGFFNTLLKETITMVSMASVKQSLGMKSGGKKVTHDTVKGLSSIRDVNHMRDNKYKEIKEYHNRVLKVIDKHEFDIKGGIAEFNTDYTIYMRVKELKEMFSFSDDTPVSSLINNNDALTYYVKELSELSGDISVYADGKIGNIVPDFSSKDYFHVFFGCNLSNEVVMQDARAVFNILLNMRNFQVYDILYSRLLISQIGHFKFIGLTSMEIANNLMLNNGIVNKLYAECLKDLQMSGSDDEVIKYEFSRLLEHLFIHYKNDESCLYVLKEYFEVTDDEDKFTSEELQNQLDCIKDEFGDDAYNLSKEFSTLK